MDSRSDRDIREKKEPDSWQDQQNKSSIGSRAFTEPDDPASVKDGEQDDSVDQEKRPTRQMTGGPDKPTA